MLRQGRDALDKRPIIIKDKAIDVISMAFSFGTKVTKKFKAPKSTLRYKEAIFVVAALFVPLSVLLGVLNTNQVATAATSDQLNFQGRLLNASGDLVADGIYNMEFNLYYVPTGGTSQWTEDRLVTNTQGVTVTNGYFSVYLGEYDAFSGIDWSEELYLGMTVRGTTTCAWGSCTPADSEMTPRFKLTSVPYAFVSANVASSDATGANSDDVSITTGDTATSGNSGNITIDVGSAVGTNGNIGVGNSNATAINIGTGTIAQTLNFGTGGTGDKTVMLGSTAGGSTTTLQAGTGGIVLGSSALSRTAAGTTTLDLVDGSNTALSLTNSGAGVANLTVDGDGNFGTITGAGLSDCDNATTSKLLWDVSTAQFSCGTDQDGGGGGSGLFTDGGTTTYLTATGDDLLLGSSTDADGTFFMDVSAGSLRVGSTGTTDIAGSLIIADANGDTTTISAGDSTGSIALVLPSSIGTANQCVKNSGTAGTLTFANCNNGSGGGGAVTLDDAYEAGNVLTTSDALDVDFVLSDTATDSNFDIDIQADNTVTISRVNGASIEVPAQLLLLENLDTDLTVTTGLKITDAGGGLTTAIDVSGSGITNAISIGANAIAGTNFSVTGGGAVTAVGVNSGAGLLQGTGGLTLVGTTLINTTGTANTTIGNATGTFDLISSGLNVSTGGALSGISTIGLTGAITGATATDTINGLIVNAGALSGISTIATSSTINGQTISSAANFTGTVAIQGATLTLGTTTQAGSLVLNEDVNDNTVTINTGAQATGSFTVSFPDNLAVNDTFCLVTKANCAGGTGSDEFITVAANDSSTAQKAAADYTADGTADEAEIESAIAEANTDGGRAVYLMAGTYNITTAIDLESNISLIGAGEGATILFVPSNTNTAFNVINLSTDVGVTIRDLTIDGNHAGNTTDNLDGISVSADSTNVNIEKVTSKNNGSDGFSLAGNDGHVSNSTSVSNLDRGILISGNYTLIDGMHTDSNTNEGAEISGTNITYTNALSDSEGDLTNGSIWLSGTNSVVSNSRVFNGDDIGIRISGANNSVTGNTIETMASSGIAGPTTANYTTISGNSISGAGWGIYFAGSNSTVTGNVIENSTYEGITLQTGTTLTVVSSNTVTSSTAGHGILTQTGSTDNTISNNSINEYGSTYNGIDINGSSHRNFIIGNNIYDASGSGVAIDINSGATETYLSSNTFRGAGANTMNDSGTDTIYGGQLSANFTTASTDFLLKAQSAGDIELLSNTDITGTLTVSQLITGQAGLTVTGAAVSLNHDSNFAVNIATGTNNTLTTIGGGSGTFSLQTTNIDISNTGAISGATTIGLSGAITGATATDTINGLIVNAGALSGITGYTQTSGTANIATTSTTAFRVQNSAAAETTLTVNTGTRSSGTAGNEIKVGNSTGTDTALTLLVIDASTADPTTNGGAISNGSLFYNSTSNKFRCYENGAWVDCIGAGGSGLFTQGTGFAYLDTTTDGLVIGASTSQSAKLAVVGDTDEVQVKIIGNATQTSNILEVEDSSNTDLLWVTNTDGAFIRDTNSYSSYGSYKTTDPDDETFATDTGNWSGTNWTIGSGVATHIAGDNNFTLVNTALDSAPVAGTTYEISFDYNTTTASSVGGVRPCIGGACGRYVGRITGTGSTTQRITATNTNALFIDPDSIWAGTIDNVTIRPITNTTTALSFVADDDWGGVEIRSGGYDNTYVGQGSGLSSSVSAYSNAALGTSALQNNTTGYENTAVGPAALLSSISGDNNVAVGAAALERLEDLSDASSNTSVGSYSGRWLHSGSRNTFLGDSAGRLLVSGSDNVFLGNRAGDNLTSGSYNIVIGSYRDTQSATGDYQLNIADVITSSNWSVGNLTLGKTSTSAATILQSGTGNITLQVVDSATIGVIQIGAGGAGTATPDFLALDVKSTTGDPAGGAEGYIYYNTFDNKFRCYQDTGWTDCIGSGGGIDLQGAYDAGSDGIIQLDGTRNGIFVQDASSTVGDIFVVEDEAGTTDYLTVTNTATTIGAGSALRVVGGNFASRPSSPSEGMIYYDTDSGQMLRYEETYPGSGSFKWKSDNSTATIIIASTTSSQEDQDAADIVVDGESGDLLSTLDGDQIEINLALTDAAGGLVYLMPGTYEADATILIPNNTTLAGSGRGSVIELAEIDAADNLIENSDTVAGTGVVVRDLKLDGRYDVNADVFQQNGIYFDGMGDSTSSNGRQGGKVSGLWLERFRDYAIILDTSGNSIITENNVRSSEGGIYLTSSNYNIVGDNNLHGLGSNFGLIGLAGSSYNTISGNFTKGTSSAGIYILASSTYNTISGNTSIENSYGIRIISSADNNTITGNFTKSNGTGIQVNSTYNTVSGNISDLNSSYGVYLESSSSDNNVTGNTVSNNTTYGIYVVSSNNNIISSNRVSNTGGSANNRGIVIDVSDFNTITSNHITDTACTTTCEAIWIASSSSDKNYLEGNRFSGSTANVASINDSGTNTIYVNQQTNTTTSTDSDVTDFTFRGSASSATAFEIQNASGVNILNVDTTSTGDALTISNSTSTGDILVLKDDSTEVLSVANGGATTFTNSANSTSAFVIQNATGADVLFTADTSNNRLVVGNSTGTGTATTLLVLDNSTDAATPTGVLGAMYYDSTNNKFKCYTGSWVDCDTTGGGSSSVRITLVPEYPGSVLTPDGVTNVGTMSSDFCSDNLTPKINTVVCPTAGDEHNYMSWYSASGTNDYDIYIRYRIPTDFTEFSSASSIYMYGWRTDGTNNKVELTLYNNLGAVCGTADTNVATGAATWSEVALGGDHLVDTDCNDIDADEFVTFKIKLTADTGDYARAGEIRFDYSN